MKKILMLAAIMLMLIGCTENTPTTTPETIPVTDPENVPETTSEPIPETTTPVDPAAQYLSTLTLEQKVGQLFIVTPDHLIEGSGETSITSVEEATNATLSECPPGGVIFFDRHIETEQQLKTFLSDLSEHSFTPLFLAVDEEGGLVARLANRFPLPQFPCAGELEGGVDAARAMGNTIGTYLKSFGFNLDFAPVADVNTNPQNPVIGIRSFSSDPEQAAILSDAMASGLREAGVIPTFKHFPGHGDTKEDSHIGLASTAKTAEEMKHCEWIPFGNATAGDMVMVGHITVPQITGNHLPATLSSVMVQDILNGQLGFEGLVVTDAMDMGAITESWSSGEAALSAIQAGCDLVLMPKHYREAFFTVRDAVLNGVYPEAQLDKTVQKILQFKIDHGILTL